MSQCNGKTRQGARCCRVVTSGDYCHLHRPPDDERPPEPADEQPADAEQPDADEPARCQGTTKAGAPCQRRAGESGFCFQHTPAADDVPRCLGKTRMGDQCKRPAKESGFCFQHAPHTGDRQPAELRPDGTMTQAALARYLGVSDERVRQYREAGLIALENSGRLDFAKALRDLDTYGDETHPNLKRNLYDHDAKASPIDGDKRELREELKRARIEKTRQAARRAKLNADELDGQLAQRDEIERVGAEIAGVVRERIELAPGELAEPIAETTDDRAAYDIIQGGFRDTLIALADEIDARFVSDSSDDAPAASVLEFEDLDEADDLERVHLLARIECEYERARLARLKADKTEGRLLPIDDVHREWATASRTLRDRILSIPDRMAAELSGVTNADRIREQLANDLDQALEVLAAIEA